MDDDERLARFVHYRGYLLKPAPGRVQKLTLKPEAFLPFKYVELSVIRHRELIEREIWDIAQEVANRRGLPLVGRGDFSARDARAQKLDVIPKEEDGMPRNHADVIGSPPDKPAQLLLAIQIAAAAEFVPPPSAA